MQMFNKILILGKELLKENEIEKIIKFLESNKFYKTLSLAIALKVGIRIPATVLLLELNKDNLKEVYNLLGLPLMIRVEYRSLPNKKVLGGIPLYSKETIRNISSFLFEKNYFPVFHPNIMRSEDQYSTGVLIDSNNKEIFVETVGEGFDASDLRLGSSIPHEQFKIDSFNFKVKEKKIISLGDYMREREKRLIKIKKINEYIEYVNKENKLLDSFEFNNLKEVSNDFYSVPKKYTPMPYIIEKELVEICRLVYIHVTNILPPSKSFAISLSYIKNIGWILWDIYSGWYCR